MKKLFLLTLFLALVWAGYAALMAFDRYFPYGRMRETPAVRPHEEPLLVMESGTVCLTEPEAAFQAMDGRNLHSPILPGDAQAVARGQVVYATFCKQCHGGEYDGNGTVGQSFAPLPADLRSSKVQREPEGILFQHISYGGAGSQSRQPALATTIRMDDRWKVISFIKSICTRE